MEGFMMDLLVAIIILVGILYFRKIVLIVDFIIKVVVKTFKFICYSGIILFYIFLGLGLISIFIESVF